MAINLCRQCLRETATTYDRFCSIYCEKEWWKRLDLIVDRYTARSDAEKIEQEKYTCINCGFQGELNAEIGYFDARPFEMRTLHELKEVKQLLQEILRKLG